MKKYHKVREYMRRSPVRSDRSPAFYATTEALRQYVRRKNRVRVKAVSKRVAS